MAYEQKVYRFGESNEIEYSFLGKYGAKGEKRAPRKKATPEQIARQNQWNREKNVRRLIKANFRPWDLWCTLKYQEGTRKPVEEAKKDLSKALGKLRRAYKKAGFPFRFIYRMEMGERGGIHIHILANRLYNCNVDTDVLIQRAWSAGRVSFESIYEKGGYAALAVYIVKQPKTEEMEGQLSLFPEEEKKKLLAFSTSRNLKRPQPERKKYSHWTMRRILNEELKPTLGYYIDRDSIIRGVNPFTGRSYLHYTECRLETDCSVPYQRQDKDTGGDSRCRQPIST